MEVNMGEYIQYNLNVQFIAERDWAPTEGACWMGCPLSSLIERGKFCPGFKDHDRCPLTEAKRVGRTLEVTEK
jgi:hypothetical protein